MNNFVSWYPGDHIALAILEMLGVVTILLVSAVVADILVARQSAAWRSVIWHTALLGVILTPFIVYLAGMLPWRIVLSPSATVQSTQIAAAPAQEFPARQQIDSDSISVPQPRPDTQIKETAEPIGSDGATSNKQFHTRSNVETADTVPHPLPVAEESPHDAEVAPAKPFPLHAVVTLLLFGWAIGSVYLTLRMLHGWRKVQALCCHMNLLDLRPWKDVLESAAQTLSNTRRPDVYVCRWTHSPIVIGVLRPRVVLSERLVETSSASQMHDILIHEYAHIVRRDPWTNLLQYLSLVLFWVHPLVHLLNRRLDQAREEVCDNHVLEHTEAPSYAETLLSVVQNCYPIPRFQGNLAMLPRHQNLERRVTELLRENRDKSTRLGLKQHIVVLVAFTAALLASAAVSLRDAASAQGDDQLSLAKTDSNHSAMDGEKQVKDELTGKIVGQILLPDGLPAAGAIVWCGDLDTITLMRRETIADTKGHFILVVPTGRWFLWARLGSMGGEPKGAEKRSLEIRAGDSLEVSSIRLEERGTLHGKLIEAETGKPIAGGKVTLNAGYALITGPDGKFETGGLSRGAHESFVVAPGRRRMRVLFDTTAHAKTELEVSVSRAEKVVGRVTDLDGKPIPSAYVGRSTSGNHFSLSGLYEACDADGRFEYEGLLLDQPVELSAGARGYFTQTMADVRAVSGGKPLEVHFKLRVNPATHPTAKASDKDKQKWRVVSGVVRNPDSSPAAKVRVRWGPDPFKSSIERQTDKDGRFLMTVPDEANWLAVLPKEFAPAFPQVEAGGDKSVEVTLKVGETARGRVLDDQGKPIEGVIVVSSSYPPRGNAPLVSVGGLAYSDSAGYSDSKGDFVVKGVPEKATFLFFKDNFSAVRNHTLTFDAAGKPEPVIMTPIGVIHGKAVDKDGKPLRNFRVHVNLPRERFPGDKLAGMAAVLSGGVYFTSTDGSFVLSGVGAESLYRITVIAEGHGEAVNDRTAAIAVNRMADNKPAIFKAGPLLQLRVQPLTMEGQPIADARVTIINGETMLDKVIAWGYHDVGTNIASANIRRGRAAANGYCDFPSLTFGGATVLIQAPGFARQRLAWRKGEEVLRPKLAPEAVVKGEVRDANGEPVEKFSVRLTQGNDKPGVLNSANDQITVVFGPEAKGQFRVGELPAAKWKVNIVSGQSNHEEVIAFTPGMTKELKIQLKK